MAGKLQKATMLAEVKAAFEGIEDNGGEWFSNLLAGDDEIARWIGKGQVSMAATTTTAILLRQRYGCQRLYFANVKREVLAEDLKTCLAGVPGKIITTVLERDGENQAIKNAIYGVGFSHYELLKRIVKVNEPKPPGNVDADYAKLEDLPRIEEIIKRYFDPLLDHWPDRDEIEAAIEEKRILVARLEENGTTVAFVSFERHGKTLWGRFLASMEEYRSRAPYGAILADQYLMLHSDVRKVIGWVGENNTLSIRVNRALGFAFDGTTEETLIKSDEPFDEERSLA